VVEADAEKFGGSSASGILKTDFCLVERDQITRLVVIEQDDCIRNFFDRMKIIEPNTLERNHPKSPLGKSDIYNSKETVKKKGLAAIIPTGQIRR
jgi:hypothetical protein